MFDPFVFIGLALLFSGLFVGRFLTERAMKLLSPQEKLALLDSFSRLRVFGALPLVFIMLAFFGIRYLSAEWMWPAYFGVWALGAGFLATVHRMVSRRLSRLGINAEYQKAHLQARWIQYFGFLAFFILNTLSPFVSR